MATPLIAPTPDRLAVVFLSSTHNKLSILLGYLPCSTPFLVIGAFDFWEGGTAFLLLDVKFGYYMDHNMDQFAITFQRVKKRRTKNEYLKDFL